MTALHDAQGSTQKYYTVREAFLTYCETEFGLSQPGFYTSHTYGTNTVNLWGGTFHTVGVSEEKPGVATLSVFCKPSFTIFKMTAGFPFQSQNEARLCSGHFDEHRFENFTQKQVLKPDAVPSIYAGDTVSTSKHVGQPVRLIFLCFLSVICDQQICSVLDNIVPSYKMTNVKC